MCPTIIALSDDPLFPITKKMKATAPQAHTQSFNKPDLHCRKIAKLPALGHQACYSGKIMPASFEN